MELNIPAIKGIGDSLIYWSTATATAASTTSTSSRSRRTATPARLCRLTYIDHLTHNVYRGRMDHWAGFYEKLFNFREMRYFDIEGKLTGLRSRAMTSPAARSGSRSTSRPTTSRRSRSTSTAYKGEGIQHIALGTDDIYATVEA